MAEKDLSQKALQEYPDVFADICNALVFKGRKGLTPDQLKQIETESVTTPAGAEWKQLYRDVFMEHTVTGVRYLILGIENQASVDQIMPLRCMGVDYAAYEKQVKLLMDKNRRNRKKRGNRRRTRRDLAITAGSGRLRKSQKLTPVITLVLYYGESPWTAPNNLLEMLELPSEEDYPGISKYIQNYGMNLVSVKDLSEEEENRFQSDFKYLIKYIRNYKNPQKQLEIFQEMTEAVEHSKETMLAMQALSRDGRFRQLSHSGEQKEEKQMCKMLDLLEERGEARGMAQGMAQGVISTYREFNLSREEIIRKLCQRLSLQEREAVEYVDRYWECS